MSEYPEQTVNQPASSDAAVSSRELDLEDVPSTDIVFECPHCAKSLSIDPRGAGLVIRCTQCGQPVTVPIPEGMSIEDFDATPEELSAQLFNTRKGLSRAQRRVAELEAEVAELRTFRENAFRFRAALGEDKTVRSSILARAIREQEASLAALRELETLTEDPPAPKDGAVPSPPPLPQV